MRVRLSYYTPHGILVARHAYESIVVPFDDVVEEIVVRRRVGQLPGLRPNSGRDHIIRVKFGERERLIIPPWIDEEDVTPVRVPTGEHEPLERPLVPPREDDK